MAETAAHLVDHVLPPVPYRQWVLTVPYRIRYLIAFDSDLSARLRRIFVRTVFSWLRKKGRDLGVAEPEAGAVVFLQRWNSALNLAPHLHGLFLDGIYAPGDLFSPPVWHSLSEPTDEDVAEILWRVRDRVMKLLHLRGLLPEDDIQSDERLPFDSPSLGACYAASVQGRVGLGEASGKRVQRVGYQKDAPYVAFTGKRCAELEGFTLHAGTRIDGHDRNSLERLCRYVARPPIAQDRVSLLPDGRVSYRLKRPWNDGTTAVVFRPLEFIEKLAALVPPPHSNLVS